MAECDYVCVQSRISQPKVRFRVENHPLAVEQKEAGKRLFARLIERARREEAITTAKTRAQAGAEAPPAVYAPHSLSGGQNFHSNAKKSRRTG